MLSYCSFTVCTLQFFMSRLRLSIVYYLNSSAFVLGFMHGGQRELFELDFSPPSRCADLLAQGKVDVGLIPAIEYQRISGLKIVPGLAVASKNDVRSVLLISKVPDTTDPMCRRGYLFPNLSLLTENLASKQTQNGACPSRLFPGPSRDASE